MNGRFAIEGVAPDTRLGKAASLTLLAKAAPLFELEAAAVSGKDMEAVHDMRVASRRLREALVMFERLYPSKEYARWYRRVRKVTKSLGAVRDADVFLDSFRSLVDDAGSDAESVALAYLIGRKNGERVARLDEMRGKVGGLKLRKRRKDFIQFAKQPRKCKEANRTLMDLAQEVAWERLEVAYGFLPAAKSPENWEAQHAMRIEVKRLRYCVETLAPCLGDSFRRVHAVFKSFQDVLGELHDSDVFLQVVRDAEVSGDVSAAGVAREGLEEVVKRLELRRARQYVRFSRMCDRYPESLMRERLAHALDMPTSALTVVR